MIEVQILFVILGLAIGYWIMKPPSRTWCSTCKRGDLSGTWCIYCGTKVTKNPKCSCGTKIYGYYNFCPTCLKKVNQ